MSIHHRDLHSFPTRRSSDLRSANIVRVFRWIGAEPERPVVGDAEADVRVGEIDLLASRLAQRYAALVGDDANDFDPYGFGRLNADKNTLADRRLTWIGTIRQNFIDDGISAARLVVLVGEGAAFEKTCAHGLEVAGKHDERIDRLIFAGVRERFLRAPTNWAEATRKRKWI